MPTTAITVHEHFGEMTVQHIVDRKRKIVEVMEAVMKDGEHYGKIPGCGDKPTLYKAGAEVLSTTFGLSPSFEIMEVGFPGNHREYRITCTLKHIATGAVLGEGVGTCSTMESKYRWRKGERKCPNCGKSAIIKGKAEYGGGWLCFPKKDGCGAKWKDGAKEIEAQESGRVENPDIADVYNTVLKIAKKRALVDCTLTAVGASDLLAQDLEDLPAGTPEYHDPADEDIDVRMPTRATVDPRAEAAAAEILVDLGGALSPDDVRKIAPRINALPKGSRARHTAFAAYQKRMTDVDPDQAQQPAQGQRQTGQRRAVDPLKDRLKERQSTSKPRLCSLCDNELDPRDSDPCIACRPATQQPEAQ
jgi:hypothetical protein